MEIISLDLIMKLNYKLLRSLSCVQACDRHFVAVCTQRQGQIGQTVHDAAVWIKTPDCRDHHFVASTLSVQSVKGK